jgi:hypothetical protein
MIMLNKWASKANLASYLRKGEIYAIAHLKQ